MNELHCASCGASQMVNAVCHHCGRPLCNDKQFCRVELNDNAFADQPRAVHCFDCARQFHGHHQQLDSPSGLDELFASLAEKLSRIFLR